MAQALEGKPTLRTASNMDQAIDKLERYANLLEAIKAMGENDEAKALKAMVAISRSVEQ